MPFFAQKQVWAGLFIAGFAAFMLIGAMAAPASLPVIGIVFAATHTLTEFATIMAFLTATAAMISFSIGKAIYNCCSKKPEKTTNKHQTKPGSESVIHRKLNKPLKQSVGKKDTNENDATNIEQSKNTAFFTDPSKQHLCQQTKDQSG